MEEVFAHMYAQEQKSPRSWKSVLQNSQTFIQFLEIFLQCNNIRSVIDIGCGDWSFSRYIQWGDVQYLGIDIVQPIIKKNLNQFAARNIRFLHADVLEMDLPKADLLLCKDVFHYWPNEKIERIVAQFQQFNHCLISDPIIQPLNDNLPLGEKRGIDLTEAPFSLNGLKVLAYPTENNHQQVLYFRK